MCLRPLVKRTSFYLLQNHNMMWAMKQFKLQANWSYSFLLSDKSIGTMTSIPFHLNLHQQWIWVKSSILSLCLLIYECDKQLWWYSSIIQPAVLYANYPVVVSWSLFHLINGGRYLVTSQSSRSQASELRTATPSKSIGTSVGHHIFNLGIQWGHKGPVPSKSIFSLFSALQR